MCLHIVSQLIISKIALESKGVWNCIFVNIFSYNAFIYFFVFCIFVNISWIPIFADLMVELNNQFTKLNFHSSAISKKTNCIDMIIATDFRILELLILLNPRKLMASNNDEQNLHAAVSRSFIQENFQDKKCTKLFRSLVLVPVFPIDRSQFR